MKLNLIIFVKFQGLHIFDPKFDDIKLSLRQIPNIIKCHSITILAVT